MKKIKIITALVVAGFLVNCSGNDDAQDTTKPTINLSIPDGFPTSCAVVQRGNVFPFKAQFSDNDQLGSYSVAFHSNFDHHSHDTEIDACPLDPIKTPVNDWREIFTFNIPENLQEYTATHDIEIPNDIDTGDYHVEIKVTDANGWSTLKGISIKIVD